MFKINILVIVYFTIIQAIDWLKNEKINSVLKPWLIATIYANLTDLDKVV